jgi:hypothetical protein
VPGEYTIEYRGVTGYSTPPAETITLPSGSTAIHREYK